MKEEKLRWKEWVYFKIWKGSGHKEEENNEIEENSKVWHFEKTNNSCSRKFSLLMKAQHSLDEGTKSSGTKKD